MADTSSRSTSSEHTPGRHDDPSPGGLTGLLWAAAAVSAISALLYGYDTGIISGALLQISGDFDTGSGMEQVIAAAILLGAVIGALVCSRLSETSGRRRTILLISVVLIVGALACSFAPSPWTLAAARVLLGFAVGGATQTVPMYIAELAPAKHRGRLVLTFQVGIGVGIVVSTLVGQRGSALADVDRLGGGACRADAPADAAAARESAVAGQAR